MTDLFNGKYRQESLLGRGAFSEVWKVTDVQTGVVQALKIYAPSTAMEDDGIEMMKHEFALMANASHQNLLRPLYFDIYEQRPFLVLSYCKNGNIKKRVGHFTERDAWKLLKDAASGLAYLHEMEPPVIHQDIKPENILIADNGSYMLTDFGVSTKAKSMSQLSNDDKVFQSAGTFPYMPPEKFTKNNLPILASDIWSLGVTVYEMLMGDLPFGEQGGLRQKLGADIPEIQGDYAPELREILVKCMANDPWERPKADELEKYAADYLNSTPTENPFKPRATVVPELRKTVAAEPPKPVVTELRETVAAEPPKPVVPEPPRPLEPELRETVAVESYEEEAAPEQRGLWKYLVAAIVVICVCIAGYLLLSPSGADSDESVPAEPVPAVSEPAATTEEPAVAPEPEPEVAPEPVSEPVPTPAPKVETTTPKAATTTPAPKAEPVPHPQADKPRGGQLSYGAWSGTVSSGKPIGTGTLTLTSSAKIRCSNGKTISVQAGDKIKNADFDEYGALVTGTWIKTDGQTETIFP